MGTWHRLRNPRFRRTRYQRRSAGRASPPELAGDAARPWCRPPGGYGTTTFNGLLGKPGRELARRTRHQQHRQAWRQDDGFSVPRRPAQPAAFGLTDGSRDAARFRRPRVFDVSRCCFESSSLTPNSMRTPSRYASIEIRFPRILQRDGDIDLQVIDYLRRVFSTVGWRAITEHRRVSWPRVTSIRRQRVPSKRQNQTNCDTKPESRIRSIASLSVLIPLPSPAGSAARDAPRASAGSPAYSSMSRTRDVHRSPACGTSGRASWISTLHVVGRVVGLGVLLQHVTRISPPLGSVISPTIEGRFGRLRAQRQVNSGASGTPSRARMARLGVGVLRCATGRPGVGVSGSYVSCRRSAVRPGPCGSASVRSNDLRRADAGDPATARYFEMKAASADHLIEHADAGELPAVDGSRPGGAIQIDHMLRNRAWVAFDLMTLSIWPLVRQQPESSCTNTPWYCTRQARGLDTVSPVK